MKAKAKAQSSYESIRVYVEGGGTNRGEQAALRESFAKLLGAALGDLPKPKPIACGGRGNAFDEFRAALRTHPSALCILIVDSEAPVKQGSGPWSHVRERQGDKWTRPDGVGDEQLHLMVESMETWIVADPSSLVKEYGSEVDLGALPTLHLEKVSKQDVLRKLARALRNTGKQYTKSAGWVLVGLVDPERVAASCPHARRFFDCLRAACMSLPRDLGRRRPGA